MLWYLSFCVYFFKTSLDFLADIINVFSVGVIIWVWLVFCFNAKTVYYYSPSYSLNTTLGVLIWRTFAIGSLGNIWVQWHNDWSHQFFSFRPVIIMFLLKMGLVSLLLFVRLLFRFFFLIWSILIEWKFWTQGKFSVSPLEKKCIKVHWMFP